MGTRLPFLRMANLDPAEPLKRAIDEVMVGQPARDEARRIFATVYRYMDSKSVDGGCHALSAIAHVLLAEKKVPSTLNAGCVDLPDGTSYSHSWVEIDDRVFDLACERPNRHRLSWRRPAVVYGVEVTTRSPPSARYGASIDSGIDAETRRIGTGTIASWLAPSGRTDWFWEPLSMLMLRIGVKRSPRALRESYGALRWRLRG